MEILLFFSQQSLFTKQIKASNIEDRRPSIHGFVENFNDSLPNTNKLKTKTFCLKEVENSEQILIFPTMQRLDNFIDQSKDICLNEGHSSHTPSALISYHQNNLYTFNKANATVLPFNIIYNNNNSNTCWIITIIHNIRANPALKEYILNICQNQHLKLGLGAVLNINKRSINQLEHYSLTHLYRNGEVLWGKCGDETVLLEGFLKNTYSSWQLNRHIPKNPSDIVLQRINQGFKAKYAIYTIQGIPFLPYFYIQPSRIFTNSEYFHVSKDFLCESYTSDNINGDCERLAIFGYKPEFLIFNLKGLHPFPNPHRHICGISLEKSIYINVQGERLKQKYSLTGISLRKYSNTSAHAIGIIKMNNKWYDTDYETRKYWNWAHPNHRKVPIKLLAAELNSNYATINLNYLNYTDIQIYVSLLFYQRVE